MLALLAKASPLSVMGHVLAFRNLSRQNTRQKRMVSGDLGDTSERGVMVRAGWWVKLCPRCQEPGIQQSYSGTCWGSGLTWLFVGSNLSCFQLLLKKKEKLRVFANNSIRPSYALWSLGGQTGYGMGGAGFSVTKMRPCPGIYIGLSWTLISQIFWTSQGQILKSRDATTVESILP